MRRLDLRSVRFDGSSETWRLLPVEFDPFVFGGEEYRAENDMVDLRLDISRVGERLTIAASADGLLHGPCERCLEDVGLVVHGEGRDVVSHGDSQVDDDDAEEAYVGNHILAADRWARDLIAEALPAKLLCREDCCGLCPTCGVNLNQAVDEHEHDTSD
jgi:uncharacterized protein